MYSFPANMHSISNQKKKKKKFNFFFKSVDISSEWCYTNSRDKQERKIGYLGYHHNLERMNSNESKYH